MKKAQIMCNIRNKESRCMVSEKNLKILNYQKTGGIYAAKDLYLNYKNELNESFVAINLLSRASAALLIEANVAEIFAYKMSKHAKEILEKYHIKYCYDELVEHILGSNKVDMCVYEKISLENDTAKEIVENVLNAFI